MIKKICIYILTFIFVFVLSSCEVTDTNVSFKIGYQYETTRSNDIVMQKIVKNQQEWESINKDLSHIIFLDEDYSYDFFKTNSIIVYTYSRSTLGGHTDILEIIRSKSELVIHANVNKGDLDEFTFGVILIEVKKEEVRNISSIKVLVK